MSLHNFNSINKSWAMYTHTLSSISGDHLTLKPHDGKNIVLEVSGNSAIVIKQGDVSYNLSNLISGTGLGTVLTIANGSDASFGNIDVSRNLNPLIVNSASLGLANKNWGSAYINTIYGETLNTYRSDKTLSINSGTLLISGELVARSNLNPLLSNRSSLGLSTNTWSNAYIRSLSGGVIEVSGNILPLINLTSNIGTSLNRTRTLFVDDLSINKINGQVYSSSGPPIILTLTSVSGDIIPSNTNLFKLGDVSRNWSNAYIRDLSVSSIDVSVNLNPLLNNLSLGLLNRRWANAYIRDVSVSSIDVSGNLNPLTNNGSSLGLLTRRWGNAYIRDVSVSSIDVSNNLNPLTNNGSSLGLSTRIWGNAYIRDVSVGNIDVSNNLNPFSSGTGGTVTQGTGGTITISGGYIIHSFTTTGTSTFRPPFNGSVEVLIVGGGGGGGPNIGGGGGGGGVIWIPSVNVTADTSYSIVVGAGGASGTNGQNSTAFTAIAAGGGTSGSWPSGPSTGGGSGGGASANQGSINQGGAGKVGSSLGTNSGFIYGCSGGNMTTVRLDSAPVGYSTRGAGGGGAGPNDTGKALDTNSNIVGDTGQTGMGSGGLGYSSAILGTSYYWAGGGGGGAYSWEISSVGGYGGWGGGGGGASYFGTGGQGGGFALNSGSPGANGVNTSGGAGGPNTGGGGGGGSHSSGPGGTGGSGIVVIRYLQAGAAVNNSSLGLSTRRWGNAYIRDISIGSIDVSINSINPFLNNRSSLGLISKLWRNAYFRDLSATNIDISTSLIPFSSAPNSSLGLPTKYWGNAYIRDISASSIDVSGNIVPSINNTLTLGSSLKRWNRVFVDNLNVTTINGATYTSGGVLSIPSDMIPSTTNTYKLGSTTKYWNNAYIRDLSLSNRAYQEISGDISWSAVNGYYGLAKDAYPSLNPLSSGVKAVQTWTRRTTEASHKWHSVCWSPELGIFVAVAYFGTNRVMTSPNGINWTPRLASELQSTQWISVCWSPQLRLFVAVGAYNGTNRVMRSIDGTTWISSTLGVESQHNWHSVCWSAELGRFLAVANGTNRVMSSKDGITWSTITAISSSAWLGVCWSKELGIFVAVSNNGIVMTSSDGINWTLGEAVPVNNWFGVCWSPELGIFVAVASGGSATRVMYSYNGTNWSNNSITGVNSNVWYSVCWSPVLNLFLAVSENGTAMTSNNGINWTSITILSGNWLSTCWSPELGIFAIVSQDGTSMALTSSLKGRPPTSYNVFDSSFNSIDETGKWTFLNMATRIMTVQGSNVTSDDRLKHNEVVIANGLEIIDQLCPKFYKKTQTLLDASYNGDLSTQAWTYEAGLIAQEVLQIPDISFAVSGGDYYEEIINYYDISAILINPTNDASNDHITRANYYSTSANYTISYNLVTQPYSLNYNSIFTYGIAAIKELHTKVKIQETNCLDEQLNSLIERIEALEESPN